MALKWTVEYFEKNKRRMENIEDDLNLKDYLIDLGLMDSDRKTILADFIVTYLFEDNNKKIFKADKENKEDGFDANFLRKELSAPINKLATFVDDVHPLMCLEILKDGLYISVRNTSIIVAFKFSIDSNFTTEPTFVDAKEFAAAIKEVNNNDKDTRIDIFEQEGYLIISIDEDNYKAISIVNQKGDSKPLVLWEKLNSYKSGEILESTQKALYAANKAVLQDSTRPNLSCLFIGSESIVGTGFEECFSYEGSLNNKELFLPKVAIETLGKVWGSYKKAGVLYEMKNSIIFEANNYLVQTPKMNLSISYPDTSIIQNAVKNDLNKAFIVDKKELLKALKNHPRSIEKGEIQVKKNSLNIISIPIDSEKERMITLCSIENNIETDDVINIAPIRIYESILGFHNDERIKISYNENIIYITGDISKSWCALCQKSEGYEIEEEETPAS